MKTYENTAGTVFDTHDAAAASNTLLGTNPSVNEPAVLSSRAGASTFQSTVQPTIDGANATVDASRQTTEAKKAAELAAASGEQLPPDVLAEMDANKTPEQKIYDMQIASWNRQETEAKSVYESLTLASKASAAAQINALGGSWRERRQLLEESNKANVANWNQQFIRSGQAEYSPGMSSDLITGKEREGARKVKELDDQYLAAVASVNAALEEKNYSAAANLGQTLRDIEKESLKAMADNAKEAAATNKKLKDNLLASSREMAISELVKQGYTDPVQIQDYLNNTDAGQQVGDITLKEISDTLKIVNPSADLAGLSADYKTFKYLKDNNDPTVSGLNYMGYLKAVHIASTNGDGNGGDVYTTNGPTVSWEDFLAQKEREMGANIDPASDMYKSLQTEWQKSANPVALGNITPPEKTLLARTGLNQSPTAVQGYFLGTPPAFQDEIQRKITGGEIQPYASVDEIHQAYDDWYSEQQQDDVNKLVEALNKAG